MPHLCDGFIVAKVGYRAKLDRFHLMSIEIPMRSISKPDKIIAIDWSGRIDIAGQRRHIVAAVITRDGVTIESGRTREEWVAWLLAEAKKTPRMVVSLDCCFSYPAWFLAEQGCKTIFDFWKHIAAGHGEKWLAQEPKDTRFWGKPHKKPAEFCGTGMPRMMRLTDMENKIVEGMSVARAAKVRGIAPKSPFQIGGSGSVGTGSLRAIPYLLQLHEAGFRIWPFESAALDNKRSQPLVVEMYARLLTARSKNPASKPAAPTSAARCVATASTRSSNAASLQRQSLQRTPSTHLSPPWRWHATRRILPS